MTDQIKNDEIDLLDLFRRMGRGITNFFKAIWKGLLYSLIFLLKNWLPLLISIIAGVALSYLLKYTLGPTYRSELILRTNAASSSEMVGYMNRLHLWTLEKNYTALSEALSVDINEISKLKDVKAVFMIDLNKDDIPEMADYKGVYNPKDTTVALITDQIAVRVETADNKLFPLIKEGLLRYVNSDSLLQRRNRVRLQHYREISGRIDYDISQLDSLQKVKYFEETRNRMPAAGGQIVFLQEQKTQLLYEDIYNLYTRKQSYESQQVLYNDIVTVLKDFAIPDKPVTRMLYYGIYVIPASVIIALIILLIRRFGRSLKDIYQSI